MLTTKTCKSLTDPAQTYKLVIALIGDVIEISFNDAATPRGLSCIATRHSFNINLTDPAQTYKLVIAHVGDVIGISFDGPAIARGSPAQRRSPCQSVMLGKLDWSPKW